MSQIESRPALSPDDALPPVQPPSAGFILQLFIVPGVIVAIIVMVWLMFNWLAQMGNDPASYVKELRRNSSARWQAAFNLATAMRQKKHDALKDDRGMALDVAGILKTEVAGGGFDDDSIRFRVYLCNAVGQFRVPEVLPTLIEAATSQRDPKEVPVRHAALKSLAVLVVGLQQTNQPFDAAQVRAVALEASQENDEALRVPSTLVFGVLGDDESLERLRALLDDGNTRVRLFAARNLAVRGDAAALPAIADLLDPASEQSLDVFSEQPREATINLSAIQAADMLAAKNDKADLTPLIAALVTLKDSDAPQAIRLEAENTLLHLRKLQEKRTPERE